ncbi:hypothetical protein C8R46DRAFT_1037617 [Mycena filopes]|nr:hypothetical protein C8R46DRAFT_1037617 [Mycena filopes]
MSAPASSPAVDTTKRLRIDTDDEYTEAPKPTAKKTKKNKKADPPPLRQPSTRSNRGRRPKNPDAAEEPAPRRTAAQIEKETAAEDFRRYEEQVTRDVAIAAVAALRIEQDAARALETQNAVMSIADHEQTLPPHRATRAHDTDSDMENFRNWDAAHQKERARVTYASDSSFPLALADSDAETRPKAKAKGKGKAALKAPKVKKMRRGDLKAAIEQQYQQNVKQKKRIQNRQLSSSDAAAALSKAGVIAKFGIRSKATSTLELTDSSPDSSPSHGGLQNMDAFSIRPSFLKKRAHDAPPLSKEQAYFAMVTGVAGPSKLPRKNDVVVVDDDSDDSDVPVRRQPNTVKVEKKIPALDFGLPQKKPVASKSKLSSKSKAPVVDPILLAFVPPAPNGVVGGLPAFVAALWTPVIMPLLHRALNESQDPWLLGFNNAQTLALVKEVIDAAVPGNTYRPVWGDVIVTRVCARLGERRSLIGTTGSDFIVAFFAANSGLFPTAQSIKEFVRYALNKRGPALFKDATPLKYLRITDRKNSKYVRATGLFESQFVIAVAAHLLKVGGTNLPYGAVALAAASVERGFYKHRSGVFDDASNFTKHTAGTAVDGYIAATKQLSERAWERIIDACNVLSAQVVDVPSSPAGANVSLDGLREGLYEPSSP